MEKLFLALPTCVSACRSDPMHLPPQQVHGRSVQPEKLTSPLGRLSRYAQVHRAQANWLERCTVVWQTSVDKLRQAMRLRGLHAHTQQLELAGTTKTLHLQAGTANSCEEKHRKSHLGRLHA